MAKGNRNLVLNCRVTDETLNKIDALRWNGKWITALQQWRATGKVPTWHT